MNIAALKEKIKPFKLDEAYTASDAERDYFHYYGLDFSDHIDRVTHNFGFINSNDQRIACHHFKNAGSTRTCFVVHGYLDHCGLYAKIIDYLLHRGCDVIAFDLPGHGLSSGKTASIESFGDYVLVLRQCLEFFYKAIPSPWHVVAQSMGAAVVMDYLLSQQYDEDTGPFEKVLLLAPLVRPTGWKRMRIAHSLLKGWLPSVKRKFTENSHDKEFLEFVAQHDPLQHRRIPTRWVTAMLRWERRFQNLSWGNNEILVVQGDADATVDWSYNQSVIAQKFPKARFMPIKGARHHLACESDPYFERLLQVADLYFERRKVVRENV
jgi:alpha-beta hydrolase superfamily lysophospholipase